MPNTDKEYPIKANRVTFGLVEKIKEGKTVLLFFPYSTDLKSDATKVGIDEEGNLTFQKVRYTTKEPYGPVKYSALDAFPELTEWEVSMTRRHGDDFARDYNEYWNDYVVHELKHRKISTVVGDSPEDAKEGWLRFVVNQFTSHKAFDIDNKDVETKLKTGNYKFSYGDKEYIASTKQGVIYFVDSNDRQRRRVTLPEILFDKSGNRNLIERYLANGYSDEGHEHALKEPTSKEGQAIKKLVDEVEKLIIQSKDLVAGKNKKAKQNKSEGAIEAETQGKHIPQEIMNFLIRLAAIDSIGTGADDAKVVREIIEAIPQNWKPREKVYINQKFLGDGEVEVDLTNAPIGNIIRYALAGSHETRLGSHFNPEYEFGYLWNSMVVAPLKEKPGPNGSGNMWAHYEVNGLNSEAKTFAVSR